MIVLYIACLAAIIFIYSCYETYNTYQHGGDPEIAAPVKAVNYTYADKELPETLTIPSLKIDTHIKHVGVTEKGNMATPGNFSDVAWYKYGTAPGFVGSAVIAGHLDNALAINGVFKNLHKLSSDDDIFIETVGGENLHYKVVKIETYPYDQAPTELIFNQNDKAHLNLVTCAGEWDKEKKTYTERLVVYAVLVK